MSSPNEIDDPGLTGTTTDNGFQYMKYTKGKSSVDSAREGLPCPLSQFAVLFLNWIARELLQKGRFIPPGNWKLSSIRDGAWVASDCQACFK